MRLSLFCYHSYDTLSQVSERGPQGMQTLSLSTPFSSQQRTFQQQFLEILSQILTSFIQHPGINQYSTIYFNFSLNNCIPGSTSFLQEIEFTTFSFILSRLVPSYYFDKYFVQVVHFKKNILTDQVLYKYRNTRLNLIIVFSNSNNVLDTNKMFTELFFFSSFQCLANTEPGNTSIVS